MARFFRYKKVRFSDRDFPCIGLFDDDILIGVPLYERWLFSLNKEERLEYQTLRKKSHHLCIFLNYLLHHTDCHKISDITLDDLRDFLLFFKTTEESRSPDDWHRGIADIYDFLIRYQESNPKFIYHFRSSDLVTTHTARNPSSKRSIIVKDYHKFSVSAPKKRSKKFRFLPYSYLDLLLFEARKYDPDLVLGIALQAYAGLREGEVVNLTPDKVKIIYGSFGTIRAIDLDLETPAPFSSESHGKIKKYRIQRVYPDFTDQVFGYYQQHNAGSDALFTDKHKKPMSVSTYTSRVKALFYDHFLPTLINICNGPENAAYIEAYQKEYPGGHMFRHWFTMYLLTKTNLTHDEISHWRGDSSLDSMADYVHANGDMINWYKKAVFHFQQQMLEEII